MATSQRTQRGRATCRRKVRHRNRTDAELAMVRLVDDRSVEPYRCPHCRGWHLATRTPTTVSRTA